MHSRATAVLCAARRKETGRSASSQAHADMSHTTPQPATQPAARY